MDIKECNKQAQEILDQYDLRVVSEIDLSWNKRDSFDWVTQRVYVGDEEMFQHYYKTNINSDDVQTFDDYGIAALSECLKLETNQNYQEQTREFKNAIAKLLKLKKEHKFTHGAEKKELRELCEELCVFGNSQSGPNPGQRVNIPLFEDNKNKIKEVLELLKNLENVAEVSKTTEEAGPQNG